MSGETCPLCGGSVVSGEEIVNGRARYDETQGGHNDRHTLVVEAAERLIEQP